jgi:hypothetical protein
MRRLYNPQLELPVLPPKEALALLHRWLELIERNLLALARQIKAVGRQGLSPLFLEHRLALMKAEEQFVAGLVWRMDMACEKNMLKATEENVVELGTNIRKAIADKLKETFDDVVQQGVPDRFVALLKQLDGQNNEGK